MKRLRITVEGKSYEVEVELLDEASESPSNDGSLAADVQSSASTAPVETPKNPTPVSSEKDTVASPLSAIVVSVDVAVGDTVEVGQAVVTLEAMKMNTTVSASVAGTVKAINVSAGDTVEEGQPLIKLG